MSKPTTITFTKPGDFQALYEAQAWCRENGFSMGSLCSPESVALMRGKVLIAKWRNLTVEERERIHGKMTGPDFRNGPVTIEIYEQIHRNSQD